MSSTWRHSIHSNSSPQGPFVFIRTSSRFPFALVEALYITTSCNCNKHALP